MYANITVSFTDKQNEHKTIQAIHGSSYVYFVTLGLHQIETNGPSKHQQKLFVMEWNVHSTYYWPADKDFLYLRGLVFEMIGKYQ